MYNAGIFLYAVAINIASLFNTKAKLFLKGRRNIFIKLQKETQNQENLIWIHAASSGEFEQARPLVELLKKHKPTCFILISFFSPSGYEMHKNYSLADYITYLPLDTPSNAKKWVATIRPTMALFIKYEFWNNYYTILNQNKIPIYSVCSIFRKEQHFFKQNNWGRKTLQKVTHFFTQDVESQKLLASISIHSVTVVGDTRFDRVYQITKEEKGIALIKTFSEGFTTIIAGSTWEPDEEILLKFMNESKHESLRLVLVPHEIDRNHIEKISKEIKIPYSIYSEVTTLPPDSKILVVDQMGILSSIYHYGELAYIGGGFGVGIHNVLEAACYGIPVIFGPNYKKFKEARDLISNQAGFSISDYQQLHKQLELLMSNNTKYQQVAKNAKEYVQQNIGATEKIVDFILVHDKKSK